MTVQLVKEFYYEKNMTLKEVTKELGISRTNLYKLISDNNFRKPSKKEKETFLDSMIQKKGASLIHLVKQKIRCLMMQ